MTNLKNRLLDEIMRVIARKFRLEICAVHKIHWHKEPGDKKFNHIDVIERDRAQITDDTKSYVREKIPVLQSFLGGHCGGYNWNPRVGDLVYVFFYHEKKGICLGNFWGWAEFPICRPTPYDICDKGGQWLKPYQDPITLDFPRQPYPPLKKPYCFRWFHGPVTGTTGKGRDWAWMMDYCHEGDAVKDCRNCKTIDSLGMAGNRGFKFYSQETESKKAHPLRDLFFNESGSYWLFDAKCCADCSECTESNCCSELFTKGRGFWTIQGALSTSDLKGHIRHYPDGTIEIHSATELVDYLAEATGARCIVTGPDSEADYAWQIKDFLTNAYAQAFKDGKIKIESPSEIRLKAPDIILEGDVTITGNNAIGGNCAHGSCSCPCGGGGCGGASGSMEEVVATIQAIQESNAAKSSCSGSLSNCCISDGQVCTSGGSVCSTGSSGSESMDGAWDSCCSIDGEMVFSDNMPVTTKELSASDRAALEAMSCCWENEPVTYGSDWLGCI